MDDAITLEDLSMRFGAIEVLRGIDLRVRDGEVTCVIGPSGSGKSTLLRCIAFLEEHTGGIVRIGGQPIGFAPSPGGGRVRLSTAATARVRRKLGMVFQQFNLWPHMTAVGNVAEALRLVRRLPRREAQAQALATLDRVGLADRARHYPS